MIAVEVQAGLNQANRADLYDYHGTLIAVQRECHKRGISFCAVMGRLAERWLEAPDETIGELKGRPPPPEKAGTTRPKQTAAARSGVVAALRERCRAALPLRGDQAKLPELLPDDVERNCVLWYLRERKWPEFSRRLVRGLDSVGRSRPITIIERIGPDPADPPP